MGIRKLSGFVGVVREGGRTTKIRIEAASEAAATKRLATQFGTENIIEVRPAGDSDISGRVSRAESEIGDALKLELATIWVSVAKWVLRGVFKR